MSVASPRWDFKMSIREQISRLPAIDLPRLIRAKMMGGVTGHGRSCVDGWMLTTAKLNLRMSCG